MADKQKDILNDLDRRSYLRMAALATTSTAGIAGIGALTKVTEVEVLPAVGFGGVVLAAETGSTSVSTNESESEPNDTRAMATPIPTGTDVVGKLDSAEVDWFAFFATGDETLTVQLTKSDATGVVSLVIYDTDGDFIDQIYLSSDTTVEQDFTAQKEGTYFAQVVNIEQGDGSYTIHVHSSATDDISGTEFGLRGFGEDGFGGVA